jgi:hypothetical protein
MRYSKTSFGNIRMKCVVVDRRYIDALKSGDNITITISLLPLPRLWLHSPIERFMYQDSTYVYKYFAIVINENGGNIYTDLYSN